jgi:hypothetical protein
MVLAQVVKFKMGTLSPVLYICFFVCFVGKWMLMYRVVEKFLEASEEEKRRMQAMYGVKVLNRLITAWEAETANRDYLRDNTVPTLLPLPTSLHYLTYFSESVPRSSPRSYGISIPEFLINSPDRLPYLWRLSPEILRLQ